MLRQTKLGLIFLLGFLTLWTVQGQSTTTLERGRQYATLFYGGKLELLFAKFAPDMQKAVPFTALREGWDQIEQTIGRETKVLEENVRPEQGFEVYVRISSFEKAAKPQRTEISLDAAGMVLGFSIQAEKLPASSNFLEYKTKTVLRLPFTEDWFVGWGGRTLEQNYHAAYPDQRFAYDLLIKRSGKSFEGDGSRNEQYFAFGKPLFAPADARVVSSVNDVPDNTPGVMNPKQVAGNHVWLDFGHGEFALLAHFKQGSVSVKAGQRIKAGEPLGLCGNSGNSSEAHLHFHLQTTPDFGKGEGLPAQFVNYSADGATVARGEPIQGQSIRTR
jgi:Peptidase family M23